MNKRLLQNANYDNYCYAKGKKNNAAILISDLIQISSTICERGKEQTLWAQLQKQSTQHKTDEG